MTTDTVENRTFAEIRVGDTAQFVHTVTKEDIERFAAASGDVNPTHTDIRYAREHQLGRLSAHSMWGGSLFSSLLGNVLPGPGTVYCSQSLYFHRPIRLGDTLTVTVTAKEKQADTRTVSFDCECRNQALDAVITGIAEVIAPAEKISQPALPGFEQHRQDPYAVLIDRSRAVPPLATVVAHPCDESSLTALVEAAKAELILPVLVGPAARIRAVAEARGLDIGAFPLIEAAHSHEAAEKAVEVVRTGQGALLMKGSLHTDELMSAVTRSATGLRTERRLSHAFIMDVPTYFKPLIVTDAAINIFPDLDDKRDICQNAIDLAHGLGMATPKVAILSAVETVRTKIPSTVDAAALCKMAERGQIRGAILDGPLAMDNAISKAAAETKGIVSQVAGEADILLVPDLEAGNILVKQLIFLANAVGAGIVLGAKVPIILTSRADNLRVKLASCAVAKLVAYHRRGALGLKP